MSETAASPGPRLKAERERRGLSSQKAADDMHLDAWVIDALETDNYARIGPAVYAKGHLRKYASLLGLPVDEILAGYASVAAAPLPPAAPQAGVRLRTTASAVHNLPWVPIVGSALAAALLIGVLWWRPWHKRGTGVPAAGTQPISAPSAAASPESAAPPPTADAATARTGAAPEPAAGAVIPAVLQTPAADAGMAGSGRASLRLSFSADSWVDVRDASGQRIFAGFGHANSVRTIAGNAPMRVYLGFAGGVQLEINERAIAIGPQFVSGNVARFEAGADGVLRRDTRLARPRD
jgi:cytoskeleton protein RodZ